MILHLSRDLMMSSTADANARAAGRAYKMVGSVERVLSSMGEQDVELLLIDLQTPGLDLAALSSVLGSKAGEPVATDARGYRTIAYAQHVEVELLQSATPLFDDVMTRGQFNKSLMTLFAERA